MPDASPDEIDQYINEQESAAQAGIRQSLATAGCSSQQMTDHLVRFAIYAKKSRG